jgi:hypothetical protein
MSSLNALRGFTTRQVYSVPERGTDLGWVQLEHSHQLQIVNVLAEYYRTYQDAGPDGSSFMRNLKNQLGNIKVRDWMLNADVALLARAPPNSKQWAKIYKITLNQESQYKSWMAKKTSNYKAWQQELEEKKGPLLHVFLLLIYILLCMFIVFNIFLIDATDKLGCAYLRAVRICFVCLSFELSIILNS